MPELRRHAIVDAEGLIDGLSELLDHFFLLQRQGMEIPEEDRHRVIGKAVEHLAGGGTYGSHMVEWVLSETGLDRRKHPRS